MCRSAADGGRRCPGHKTSSDEESYAGTPWEGYAEYMQRSDELDARIAAGESVTDIMRQEQLERGKARIAEIVAEGW